MKFSAFYVLDQLYLIHIDIAVHIKLQFNFTSHLRLCLPNCLFPSSFMIKILYALFRSLHITCSALISSPSVGISNHILREIHDMELIIILLSPYSILLSLPRFYSKYHPQQSVFSRLKSVLPAGRKSLTWRNNHKIFSVYFKHCVISCSKIVSHKILSDNKYTWNKYLIYLWIWFVFLGYFQMRITWFYDFVLHSNNEAVIALLLITVLSLLTDI
jgi:hypothetical protein